MRIPFAPRQRLNMGDYTDKILGYANETFSVLHHHFLKEIWGDNKTTAKLHSNQCHTDWQNGRYEVYIPTRDSVNYNLEYYRVAIQVLPEASNETKREEANKLRQNKHAPLGIIESELLILIAPKVNHWVPGGVRGFKHLGPHKPYFTAVFVNKSPEIIWKRVLDHIHNFISKRMDGLMCSLGFETWVWKWLLRKNDDCSNILSILKHFSYSIRQSAETFVKLIQWFRDKMKLVLEEIGVQNVALSKTTREIREEIQMLKKALLVKVKEEVQRDMLRVAGLIPNG
jgi:adenosyl cobinamide kinase/adenosyl cobinamide phosphate guanylyltransferase